MMWNKKVEMAHGRYPYPLSLSYQTYNTRESLDRTASLARDSLSAGIPDDLLNCLTIGTTYTFRYVEDRDG